MRETSVDINPKTNKASVNLNVTFVQEAFRKLLIESNYLLNLKREQEQAVNCLLEGRHVFVIMPISVAKVLYFNHLQ